MGRVHEGPPPLGWARYERGARSYYVPVVVMPAESSADEATLFQRVHELGGEVWKTPAPRADFCARCHQILDVHHGLGVCPSCDMHDGPPSSATPLGFVSPGTPMMLRADFRTHCISVASPLLLPAAPQWEAWGGEHTGSTVGARQTSALPRLGGHRRARAQRPTLWWRMHWRMRLSSMWPAGPAAVHRRPSQPTSTRRPQRCLRWSHHERLLVLWRAAPTGRCRPARR